MLRITYKDGIDPAYTKEYISGGAFNCDCIYCGSKLVFEKIKKLTNYSFKDFKKSFKSNDIILKELQPDADWRPGDPDDLSVLDAEYYKIFKKNFWYEGTRLGRCLVCGWWKIIEEYNAVNDNIWQIFFEIVGTIKNFEISDLSAPISEIRSHLVRKYKDRFYVNPRVFENTVASVFKDLGYDSICTVYSNDGGIDAILSGRGEPIAVQVKRTKYSIKIEQIRSFLGALMINKFNKGIYVCTSDYQSGCNKIARQYCIELINGPRFFDKLKEAQIIQNSTGYEIDFTGTNKLFYYGSFPMNSL